MKIGPNFFPMIKLLLITTILAVSGCAAPDDSTPYSENPISLSEIGEVRLGETLESCIRRFDGSITNSGYLFHSRGLDGLPPAGSSEWSGILVYTIEIESKFRLYFSSSDFGLSYLGSLDDSSPDTNSIEDFASNYELSSIISYGPFDSDVELSCSRGVFIEKASAFDSWGSRVTIGGGRDLAVYSIDKIGINTNSDFRKLYWVQLSGSYDVVLNKNHRVIGIQFRDVTVYEDWYSVAYIFRIDEVPN